MNKRVFIYDLETLDIFTAYFIDAETDDEVFFVISKDVDQRKELKEFLETKVSGLVGYNCIHFDSQILEYLYRYPDCSPADIRRYAAIITSDNDRFPDVPEWKLRVPHLDLYKVHHYDNKNRMVSLKWCEFGMDLENIEDMPSQGEGENWTEMVLSYNRNDVIATKELYKRSLKEIKLRSELKKLYGLNFINASNSKIGSDLLLDLYCKATGKFKKDVKSLRTSRADGIDLKDIIFPYIQFGSKDFNKVLDFYNDKRIYKTKGEIEFSTTHKSFKFDYGAGGIHGSLHNKVVNADDYYVIIDSDVASLYPSIAIANDLYPEHLGPEFTKVYNDDLVAVRLAEKAKKENGNQTIVAGFKEAANSAYGKSNDTYSWLYDPKYTLATTINGQLMLSMLAEWLMKIPDLQLIQINTDGLTSKLPRSMVDTYMKVCADWENLTKLVLEHAEYSKMVIFDVNNYLAVYTNGKVKNKGRLEYENIPLHKNKSYSIIPKAVHNYFVHGTPIEDTIYSERNIFEFCAGKRVKGGGIKGKARYELHSINEFGGLKVEKLSKTVRYFISNTGKYLMKAYEDGSYAHVEAPLKRGKFNKSWKVTYFNKSYKVGDFSEYDIDYSYYIHQAREWIYQLENKEQLELF